MAGAALAVRIMTPRAELAELEATEVNLPASDGYLGIFAGHAPLIATIGTGMLTLRRTDADPQSYFVACGVFRVTANQVQILADVAESSAQIDLERATASKTRAEQRLKEALQRADIDIVRASASLQRALHRIAFGRATPAARP